MEVTTRSKLTCPECGFVQEVEMPTEACQFLYECVHCKFIITAKGSDCCVFCSYADTPCPSKQVGVEDLT